jgi:hypothetical protein
LLSLVGAAAELNNQRVADLAEIDPAARADIERQFRHTAANGLQIGRVALFQPVKRSGHLRGDLGGERSEPVAERRTFCIVQLVFHGLVMLR